MKHNMLKLRCPHCNQRAMSVWQKLNTNFAWCGTCASCGNPIGVPAWSLHVWLLLVTAVLLAGLTLSTQWVPELAILLLLFFIGLQLLVVPLERRNT